LPSVGSLNDNQACPRKAPSGQAWLEAVYSNTAKVLPSNCTDVERIGRPGDGGKWICKDHIKQGACVIYSLGSSNEFSFEQDAKDRLGCEVHTFDCTIGSRLNTPGGVHFHP